MKVNNSLEEIVKTYDPMELQFALYLEALKLRQPEDEFIARDYEMNQESICYLNECKEEIFFTLEQLDKKLYDCLKKSDIELNRFLFNLLPSTLF